MMERFCKDNYRLKRLLKNSVIVCFNDLSKGIIHPSKHLSWWRRTEDVFSVTLFCLTIRLEDIIERRLANMSWRRLEDALKKSWRCFRKTYCKYVLKTSSRGLGRRKVLRWRRLEDVLENKKCLLGYYIALFCRRREFLFPNESMMKINGTKIII